MLRNRKFVAPLLAVTALALIVIPVYAITEDSGAKATVAAMDAGKVTLGSAVSAAEAAAKGKAVSAHADLDDGKLELDVKVLVGDKIMKVMIDGAGKAGTPKESKKILTDAKATVAAMDAGKVTLGSAVSAAEAAAKGKAVSAHAEMEDGKLHFEVFVLAGDKTMEVAVDAAGKAGASKEVKKLLDDDNDDDDDAKKPPVKGG